MQRYCFQRTGIPVKTLYLDTNYLFRMYWEDPGFDEVRQITRDCDCLVSAWHAEAEFESILLRKRREGVMNREISEAIAEQFAGDKHDGGLRLLSLDENVMACLRDVMRNAPPETFLRAADALHLACANVNGFKEVYSNDTHFLNSADLFNMTGVNVIPRR